MSSIRAVGPDGSSFAATPTGMNTVIFDPVLPAGSKIYSGDLLIGVVPDVAEPG